MDEPRIWDSRPLGDQLAAPLERVGERYAIVREVGRGAMGRVYEALDAERDGARCAIKVLGSTRRSDADRVERFRREAELGRALGEHPHIVGVSDAGAVPETGELFFAMDFVDGVSLETAADGLSIPRAVEVMQQVAEAVAFAHARRVIHRDLKPNNVLLARDETIRLTDFGLARALDAALRITATGTVLGTPSFIAPEQIRDAKRAGPLADVYALGAVLYRLLTGSPPHPGTRLREVLVHTLREDARPADALNPEVDPVLSDLCASALSRDVAARPESAQAFADALRAWRASA